MGNRNPGLKDAAAAAQRKARKARAFELRCQGASVPQISRELGIGEMQVRRDLKEYADRLGFETNEQKRAQYSRMLENSIIDTNLAIAALRPLAIPRARNPGEAAPPVDIEASRAMASHERVLRQLIAELAMINGARAPQKVQHEHTGAGGGPVRVSLDDVLQTVMGNEAGVDAERGEPVH